MRFPTFIVLLHAKTRWLTPPELEGKVEFGMQSRIDADFAFVSVVSDPTKAKELLAAHVLDIAATDAEVWTKFPVLRGDFVVKVNRRALFEERTLEVRLRETVVGDQLCVNKAAFISAIENGFQLPGTQSQIEYDFELPIADIAAECPHFAGSEEPSALSVEGKAIFFLDAFSVSGLEDSQLTKQMRFMSPRAFARDTNFIALVQEADQKGFSRLADRLPTNFSSVLVVDEGEEGERNFAWAMVGRVLACVAALSNCQGRIAVEARISSTGWSTRS